MTLPRLTYSNDDLPAQGTAVAVEYSDGVILWDDLSDILWDDGTQILWSHFTDTSPDVNQGMSMPRTVYAGEGDV